MCIYIYTTHIPRGVTSRHKCRRSRGQWMLLGARCLFAERTVSVIECTLSVRRSRGQRVLGLSADRWHLSLGKRLCRCNWVFATTPKSARRSREWCNALLHQSLLLREEYLLLLQWAHGRSPNMFGQQLKMWFRMIFWKKNQRTYPCRINMYAVVCFGRGFWKKHHSTYLVDLTCMQLWVFLGNLLEEESQHHAWG